MSDELDDQEIDKKISSVKSVEELEQPDEFDFDLYGEPEEEEKEIKSLGELKRAGYTAYKSRYPNHFGDVDRLNQVCTICSENAIDVASRTQNKEKLWKLYGALDELWAIIGELSGEELHKEIKRQQDECVANLNKYESGRIPDHVHLALLKLRDQIYRIKQYDNLSFEVVKRGFAGYSGAKKKIMEA